MDTEISWEVTDVDCRRGLSFKRAEVGSSIELSDEYYRQRSDRLTAKKKKKGIRTNLMKLSDKNGVPVPRSKSLSLMAVRGWRDLQDGKISRLPERFYERAPGLDSSVFEDKNQKSILPKKKLPPVDSKIYLTDGSLSNGIMSGGHQNFHQWFLHNKRSTFAQVDQGRTYAASVVSEEEVVRHSLIKEFKKARNVFSAVYTTSKVNNAIKLEQLLSTVDDYIGDAIFIDVVLAALPEWLSESWAITQFMSQQGLQLCAAIFVRHLLSPSTIRLSLRVLVQILKEIRPHSSVCKAGLVSRILEIACCYESNSVVRGLALKCLYLSLLKTPTVSSKLQIINNHINLSYLLRGIQNDVPNEHLLCDSARLLSYVSLYPFTHSSIIGNKWVSPLGTLISSSKTAYPGNWKLRTYVIKMIKNMLTVSMGSLLLEEPLSVPVGSYLLDTVLEAIEYYNTSSDSRQCKIALQEAVVTVLRFCDAVTEDAGLAMVISSPAVLRAVMEQSAYDSTTLINIHTIEEQISSLRNKLPVLSSSLIPSQLFRSILHPVQFASFRRSTLITLLCQLSDNPTKPTYNNTVFYNGIYKGDLVLVKCIFSTGTDNGGSEIERVKYEVQQRCVLWHSNLINHIAWSAVECVPVLPDLPSVDIEGGPHTVFYIITEQQLPTTDGITGMSVDNILSKWTTSRTLLLDDIDDSNHLQTVIDMCDYDTTNDDDTFRLQLLSDLLSDSEEIVDQKPTATYDFLFSFMRDVFSAAEYLSSVGHYHVIQSSDIIVFRIASGYYFKLHWCPCQRNNCDNSEDLRSLAMIIIDMLFYSSDASKRLFLSCGVCPNHVSPLLRNALLAPCFNTSSLTDVEVLHTDGLSREGCSSKTASELRAVVMDLILLSSLKPFFLSEVACAGESVEKLLHKFLSWVCTCMKSSIPIHFNTSVWRPTYTAVAHVGTALPACPKFEVFPTVVGDLVDLIVGVWDITSLNDIPSLFDDIPLL